MKTSTKKATLSFPYFKQGDDMNCSALNSKNGSETISNFIQLHTHVIRQADEIRNLVISYEINGTKIEIDGDCHQIWIEGPTELIDKLIELKLACDDLEDDEDLQELAFGDQEGGEKC